MERLNTNIVISPKQVLSIFNILRAIGLNTSHKGSKYISKAVQLVMLYDSDVFSIEKIYKTIAQMYNNTTAKQVKNDITYTLNSRVEEKAIKNFKEIFGFEYDDYLFTNKVIIEEIARIVNNS